MYRVPLILAVLAAFVVWVGADAIAQQDEFQLPPVKLKPDRPTKTKPIPPAPDERDVPKPKADETPPEMPKKAPPVVAKPAEPPKKAPPAPVPVAPPAKLPESVKVPDIPPAPGTEKTPKITPADLPLPPTEAGPAMEPKLVQPTVLAKPETTEVLPVETPPPVVPTEVQAEAAEAQVEPTAQVDLSGMGEVGLVEEVARARKLYARALAALKNHYVGRGTVHKIEWATTEISAFDKVPKPQYLIVAELAGPNLRPTRAIEAADQLYEEGLHYKNYPALPPGKKDYLKIALDKFRTIVEKYPESDKIDDAAFLMGDIYGGWYFQDWARAVQSYQRCWQWNPESEHPAYLNAAKIYDEKLKNRVKAAELYNRVIATSKSADDVRFAQDRLRALTGT